MTTDQIAAEAAERIGTHTDIESSTAIIKAAIEKAVEYPNHRREILRHQLHIANEKLREYQSRAAHASEEKP